jgi:hypothetical protein
LSIGVKAWRGSHSTKSTPSYLSDLDASGWSNIQQKQPAAAPWYTIVRNQDRKSRKHTFSSLDKKWTGEEWNDVQEKDRARNGHKARE